MLTRRDYANQPKYINAAAMDATINGPTIRAQWAYGIYVTAAWTGGTTDPNGTLTLQGSNDGSVWYTVEDFATSPDGTGAGSTAQNFTDLMPAYLRVIWTRSAGSADANLTVDYTLKS